MTDLSHHAASESAEFFCHGVKSIQPVKDPESSSFRDYLPSDRTLGSVGLVGLASGLAGAVSPFMTSMLGAGSAGESARNVFPALGRIVSSIPYATPALLGIGAVCLIAAFLMNNDVSSAGSEEASPADTAEAAPERNYKMSSPHVSLG